MSANDFEPYVGPRPFQRIDEAFFFGRDKEASEILSLIIANPILLLYARSGAGKTSLINAKVAPMLEAEGLTTLPLARVQGHVCDSGDLKPAPYSNIYALNTLLNWKTESDDAQSLATMTLAEFLSRESRPAEADEPTRPRVIVFDQFEELFTFYADRWMDRIELFRQISDLLEGGPVLLRPSDLTDPSTLMESLASRKDPLSTVLFPGLSHEARKLIEKRNGTPSRPEELAPLLNDLNQFIQTNEVFDERVLADLELTAETKALAARVPGVRELPKLNRMLLQEAYPRLIRRRAPGDPLLRVVFSMREDYIAELDPFCGVLPNKLRIRYRLEPLRERAALAAVKGPLEKTDCSFAPGVAEQLVQNLLKAPVKTSTGAGEVASEFVEPVQLQVVCQSLWEKVHSTGEKVITPEHLRAYGDVGKALRGFYERTINRVLSATDTKEWAVRRWFEEVLITTAGTRGMVFRGNEKTGELRNNVVDELESQHIIRAELRAGERFYELSHDRFIQPVRDSNNEWRLARSGAVTKRRELEDKAAAWISAGGGEEGLLDESAAIEAKRWLQSSEATEIGYSQDVFAFVQSSRLAVSKVANAREREIFERDRAQAQAIAQEQRQRAEAERLRAEEQEKRAEAERLRAEEQKRLADFERKRGEERARSNARMRRLAAGLAVMFIVAAAFGAFAFDARNKAFAARNEALAARNEALEEKKRADVARAEAVKEKNNAVDSEKRAVASEHAAQEEKGRAEDAAREAMTQRMFAERNAEEAKKQSLIAKQQADLAKHETERANQATTGALQAQAAAEKAREEEKQAKLTAQLETIRANAQTKIAEAALKDSEQQRETIARQLGEIKTANQTAIDAKTADEMNTRGRSLEEKGDFQGARESYQKALDIYQKSGDLESQADALQRIGFVYHRSREESKAIEVNTQVLRLRRQLNDRVGEANALHSLGISYQNTQRNQEAIQFYQQALSISGEIGDKSKQIDSLMGLAGSSFNLGKYDEGISFSQRARELALQLGDIWHITRTYSMLGSLYNQKKDYDKALENYQKALTLFEKDPRRNTETAETLTAIGQTYQSMGDEKKALMYFERARAVRPQSPVPRE